MKSKKNKKSRERKIKSSKEEYGIKISEAILKLSEPLREQYRELHRVQVIITLTIIAWNMALLPETERKKSQSLLIIKLSKIAQGDNSTVLLDLVHDLIKQKNKYYPEIKEYIIDYNLSVSNQNMSLTVSATPFSEQDVKDREYPTPK